MKKTVVTLVTTLFILSSLSFALRAAGSKKSDTERFYGKIAAIDTSGKTLSVHNRTKNADAVFTWNDTTEFVSEKQPIQATQLKTGDFLMVAYKDANGAKQAVKVVLRANFGKKKAG